MSNMLLKIASTSSISNSNFSQNDVTDYSIKSGSRGDMDDVLSISSDNSNSSIMCTSSSVSFLNKKSPKALRNKDSPLVGFKCIFCPRILHSKESQIYHLKTHTGEKPFACKLCDYRCITKSQLVNHNRCHTGEKPFSCHFCAFKCSQKSNLESHIARRHASDVPPANSQTESNLGANRI